MKKRLFVLMMIGALSCTTIACGDGESGSTNNNATVRENDSDETADEKGEDSDEVDDSSKSAETTIESQELFNQNGIVITATEFAQDGTFGPEIKLLIENNSDKNITVQTRNSSINGCMADLQISSDIVSGKKTNDTLIIPSSDLEASGIETISDIEFSFHIFDTESWDTIVDSDMITISTSANGTFEQQYDSTGNILYDNNGIKIISKGLLEDSIFGPCVSLYIENNSEQNITIQTKDTSVNGFMTDTIFSSEIMPGKIAFDEITFMSTTLEENGIASIDEIETSFHIFDTNSWENIADIDSVVISLN